MIKSTSDERTSHDGDPPVLTTYDIAACRLGLHEDV